PALRDEAMIDERRHVRGEGERDDVGRLTGGHGGSLLGRAAVRLAEGDVLPCGRVVEGGDDLAVRVLRSRVSDARDARLRRRALRGAAREGDEGPGRGGRSHRCQTNPNDTHSLLLIFLVCPPKSWTIRTRIGRRKWEPAPYPRPRRAAGSGRHEA